MAAVERLFLDASLDGLEGQVYLDAVTDAFLYPTGFAALLEARDDRGSGVYLSRDEVQALVDKLVEIAEAYDEANRLVPEVGKLYRLVSDEGGSYLPVGSIVLVLPDPEGFGEGLLLVTRNLSVQEWESDDDVDIANLSCRYVSANDLAEI
ncbi:MAG: hypothetical protein ACRCYU_12305 [Nocardioides sp.]